MPQLAPLHWLGLSLAFWFLIAMVSAFLWWTQSPQQSINLSLKSSSAHAPAWMWK